jgi:plastocyanin
VIRLALLVAAGAAGVWIAAAASAPKDNPVLEAIVGTNDGFNITLNDTSGNKVVRLDPGTYTVIVHDRSTLHNFHMASNFDSSVDIRTDLEFVGDATFTVTFKPGIEYAYACEPHWQVMNGSFFVNSPTTSPTTTVTPPPPTLAARVTAAGVASLRPARVRAGLVRIVVRDDSARHNFHLSGTGVNRKTSRAFVGRTTWKLRLGAGVYHFGSDPQRLRGVLRVF